MKVRMYYLNRKISKIVVLKSIIKALGRITRIILVLGLICNLVSPCDIRASEPVKVSLADDGQALHSVVVGEWTVSRPVINAAKDLAEYLGKISGATFTVKRGDGMEGIVVGNYKDFPALGLDSLFNPEDLTRRDEYLLRTHSNGIYLIGATDLAAQHAAWDFLYRIGYRQFFPGKDWEIIPDSPDISIALDEFESPDYRSRNLIYGSGQGHNASLKTRDAFEQWRDRNRLTSGFTVIAGHAYGDIIRANQAYFDAHPEDLIGTGANAKFDPTRSSVLNIVSDYAIRKLEANPDLDIISMEPSDGGGWRQDSPLGSVTNQVVTLANHVARVIQKRFPGKKVGILGYNFHSAPPTIEVDPNVVVMVSEYAIREGLEFEPILIGWKEQGADVGVTNPVFNIWSYYRGLPGQGNATDLDRQATSIPRYYELGARYWAGNSTPDWAPYGLGHYLISRFLWDTSEAQQLPELLDDFYNRSFGAAAPVMREYYERYLLASGKPLFSEDLIGRMYRKLEEALSVADSPGAVTRIESYIIHVRYLELYLAYQVSTGTERQENYEAMARYAYSLRERESDMISSYAVIKLAASNDNKIELWDEKVHGQDVTPLNDNDLRRFLHQGIANNELVDFTPVSFSTDLVPWHEGDSLQGEPFTIKVGGDNLIYLYPKEGKDGFTFEVSGGLNYSNYGPVRLRLFAKEHAVEEPIAEVEVPADKKLHTVHFDTPYKGLHWLEFGDGSVGGSSITWPGGQRVALPASISSKINFSMPRTGDLFFYVPKGTNIVGGYSESPSGQLVSADGKIVLDFKTMEKPGYFSVVVPKGQDGIFWRFARVRGNKLLMTVPPYLAHNEKELLLPREVVEADKDKEIDIKDIQPFYAEPFFAKYNHRNGGDNSFMELVNPGTEPLDMSNYMVCMSMETNPDKVIQAFTEPGEWLLRYTKYIPGYKYVDSVTWVMTPGILEQDVNVNPIVTGGGVFVYGYISDDRRVAAHRKHKPDYLWNPAYKTDVQFNNYEGEVDTYSNPWGENIAPKGNPVEQGYSARESLFLFKILNDSIKLGLKPPNDPNDFEVIDAFGMADGSQWRIGHLDGSSGFSHTFALYTRKPGIWKGNPVLGASFGLTAEDSLEWIPLNNIDFGEIGFRDNERYLAGGDGIGSHYFIKPTHYKSTITSVVYKVSPGYGRDGGVEEILEITDGTSVSQFLSNLIKADEGQTLTVISIADGSKLAMDAILSQNDKLVVLSADSTNTTNYRLDVTDKVTSIKNLPHNGGDIKVYPNPARGTIYIQMEDMNEEITGVDIYNSVGIKVKTLHGDKINVPRINIDIQHFSPGLYMFRFKFNDRFIIKKIIIE